MEKVFTTIKLEESIKENGFRIKSKVMALWSMLTKTSMKATGLKDKGMGKELMNTQMVIHTQESGKTIQKMAMEFCKWQLEICMKEIGLREKRTALVLLFTYLGKYRFTNGDIYEGNFKNGNR